MIQPGAIGVVECISSPIRSRKGDGSQSTRAGGRKLRRRRRRRGCAGAACEGHGAVGVERKVTDIIGRSAGQMCMRIHGWVVELVSSGSYLIEVRDRVPGEACGRCSLQIVLGP